MRVVYARSQSFGLDAKVFWETLLCVLKKNLNREPSVRRKMSARQGGNLMNCQKSRELAYKIRLHALEMTSRGGTSHIASIFSAWRTL